MEAIKTSLAKKGNYGALRNTSKIKYIVVHYTGNDGDTDEANAKYFRNNLVKASAHYFVDDDSIIQSVPDNHVAYHCGSSRGYYHANCRNANSIGVEMCDTLKDNVHNVSDKTRENTIELIRTLMKKYNIPISNVIRHYDVTHKCCPAYYVADEVAWNYFKNDIVGGTSTNSIVENNVVTEVDTTPDTIKEVQAYLNSKGITDKNGGKLDEDGKYGSLTRSALLKYLQKAVGVNPDGCWGGVTRVAVGTLGYGDVGEDVRALQMVLICEGISVGKYGADGDFGNSTKVAVLEYQGRHADLADDGMAGKNTLTKLFGKPSK